MNRFVAEAFGALLTGLHILVIIGLFYLYFNGIDFLYQYGIDSSNLIWVLITFFVIYIIFAGLFSTIVSIHEQLVKLNDKRN